MSTGEVVAIRSVQQTTTATAATKCKRGGWNASCRCFKLEVMFLCQFSSWEFGWKEVVSTLLWDVCSKWWQCRSWACKTSEQNVNRRRRLKGKCGTAVVWCCRAFLAVDWWLFVFCCAVWVWLGPGPSCACAGRALSVLQGRTGSADCNQGKRVASPGNDHLSIMPGIVHSECLPFFLPWKNISLSISNDTFQNLLVTPIFCTIHPIVRGAFGSFL